MKKKKPISRRKNSTQIGFEQHNFNLATRRLNSYQRTGELVDRLKIKLREKYNHLNFEHASKIFEIEEALESILEMLWKELKEIQLENLKLNN